MPLMNMFAHNTNIIQNTNSHPAASCEEFFRLKELKALSEDDETKDIDTLNEFKMATEQWRIK